MTDTTARLTAELIPSPSDNTVAAALSGVQAELRAMNTTMLTLSSDIRNVDGRLRTVENDVAALKARPEPKTDAVLDVRVTQLEQYANSRRMTPAQAIAASGSIVAMVVAGFSIVGQIQQGG